MEPSNLFQIICFSVPILIVIGIIILAVIILVITRFVRRTRRKMAAEDVMGNTIRKQLANFDQYVQNDRQQTAAWQNGSSIQEPALDLEAIDSDTSQGTDPLPDWDADSLVCPACGAPHQQDEKTCSFCGHTYGSN